MLLGCDAAGACRGVEANCGDLPSAFASTPVEPYFPDGLADYTCHAFPDDERPVDSFIVALIALAIALPVTLFLQSAFEMANDSECPEVRRGHRCTLSCAPPRELTLATRCRTELA